MKGAMSREQANASVPADHGLSSLGLIMQLGGSVAAAGTALAMFVMVFAMRSGAGDGMLWTFAVLALCVTRSMYHRLAGTEMLYGSRPGYDGATTAHPFAGVRRYIIAAVIQTAITALIASLRLGLSGKAVLGLSLGMLVWPAVLGALTMTPRFRRLARIPVGEDKGFEGAAILMTVLGLCGAAGTGYVLIASFDNGRLLAQGPGVLMMLALLVLLIRSVLHVQAGLSGLRETSVDRAVERANRYASFGVISAFCATGAMMLVLLTERFDLAALAIVAGSCWMLMVWPLAIRRFFSDRQFAEVLAGDQAAVHRRAPDAGLTGLGWLLIGHAAFVAMNVVPALVGGGGAGERLGSLFTLGEAAIGTGSIWWHVGLVLLELWAGLELIKMSAHHRVIALAYGAVGVALTLYLHGPALEHIAFARGALLTPAFLMFVSTVTAQIVLSLASVLLVLRQIAPTARARFRTKPAAPA
jgi:hypothetical protein